MAGIGDVTCCEVRRDSGVLRLGVGGADVCGLCVPASDVLRWSWFAYWEW